MTEKTELQDIIAARISEQGRMTFAEFMGACLYEPGLGYYTSPGRKVGAEGDVGAYWGLWDKDGQPKFA